MISENSDIKIDIDAIECHKFDAFDEERPSVRWAPLGATSSPEPTEDRVQSPISEDKEVIKRLEEEQEKLTSSLTLMTNHFAQIQFRLKQLAEDKSANMEDKLKELEEFANKGVPDVWSLDDNDEKVVDKAKACQSKMINELKVKLEELELYAYQVGESKEPPTSKVLANQKFIIEQLKSQLDINFDELTTLNESDLKSSVNNAINDIINPVKVREKLVDQLKTQISDLERFIEYLQAEESNNSKTENQQSSQSQSQKHSENKKKAHEGATIIIRKALNLLQLIAASQFGCHLKEKKKLNKSNIHSDLKDERMHWGDIRALLEVTIEKIIELTNQPVFYGDSTNSDLEESTFLETEYDSDDDKNETVEFKKKLLFVIRKQFCPQLIKLISHGLINGGQIGSMKGGISCFSGRTSSQRQSNTSIHSTRHPWDLVNYFYEMKNGKEIVNSPACKLSESFYLSNVGGKQITDKERLLKAIGIILDSHSVYRRSKDTQFKAFICLALNERCLYDWLKIILKNRIILYSFYETWSYAHKMGFDDTLHSLKRLSNIDFDLPYDLSVRQLSKIKDAF